MKGLVSFAVLLSAATVTSKPLIVGKNGPVVKAEAGTMGMDPRIFKPLQKREELGKTAAAPLSPLEAFASSLRRRQEEIDSILNALAENNPEDAAAAKQSLNKRADDTSDEAAELLALETAPAEKDTEASKSSLDADVLAANGLNTDSTNLSNTDSSQSQSGTDTSGASSQSSETSSADADTDARQADGDGESNDDAESLEKRQIEEAKAALDQLEASDPEDAQLARAFVTPVKRQQSLTTVTTTTTTSVSAAQNDVSTVTATATETITSGGNNNAAAAAATASAEATSSAESSPTSVAAAAESMATASANVDSNSTDPNAAAASSSSSEGTNAATSTESSTTASQTSSNGRTTFDNSQGVEVPVAAINGDAGASTTENAIKSNFVGTDIENGGFTYSRRRRVKRFHERKIRRSGTLMFFRP